MGENQRRYASLIRAVDGVKCQKWLMLNLWFWKRISKLGRIRGAEDTGARWSKSELTIFCLAAVASRNFSARCSTHPVLGQPLLVRYWGFYAINWHYQVIVILLWN